MRPGIIIQHARESRPDSDLVRSDITGLIGVIPRGRWPAGAAHGDFVELPVSTWDDFVASPLPRLLDPVSVRAIHAFFLNGGDRCNVIGLCLESEQALMSDNPFDETFHALLDRLRGEEDLGLIVMPILAYLPIRVGRRGAVEVPCQPTIELLAEHCYEMNNRFLVVDTPRDLHDDALSRWVGDLRDALGPRACFAAIYYPWLMNGDELFPPSGSVAGVYARVEREHEPFGVRWPPANQVLRGVTHPAVPVRWRESDVLIEQHINPILTQPSRGVVIWGARTLSRDPKWLHINSRRIVSMISEQLRRDSEWVVFEHQRPALWEIVKRQVRLRLDLLWGAGLLTGEKAGLEYEVQCDEQLNPPEVRDAGQVNVRVLIRPIQTAEYIVVELRLGV